MQECALTVAVIAAIPTTIFAGMMGAAAIALCSHGENPRQVLAMPRTFFRNRGHYRLLHGAPAAPEPVVALALDAVGD